MAVERIVERADDAVDVENGAELSNLFRRYQLGFEIHVTVLGALGLKEIHAVRIGRDRESADMVEPRRLVR